MPVDVTEKTTNGSVIENLGSPSVLVERMLAACAESRFESARADLDGLLAWRGALACVAQLEAAASGARRVFRDGRTFLLAAPGGGDDGLSDFARASSFAADRLGKTPPVIAVLATSVLEGGAVAREEFPGFCVIACDPAVSQPQRALHEVAHCFGSCHSLLLSEGFAIWFASTADGDLGPMLPPSISEIRALAGIRAGSGLLFEGAAKGAAHARDVALRTAAAVAAKSGPHGLLRAMAAWDAAATPLEAVSGLLAAAGIQEKAEADETEFEAVAADALEVLRRNWPGHPPHGGLAQVAGRLESAVRAGAGLDVRELLCTVLIADARMHLPDVSPDWKRIDGAIADAGVAGARAKLLQGQKAVLQLMAAKGNLMRVAVESRLARASFEGVLECEPNNPEALIHLGTLLARTPAKYGGGLGIGLNILGKVPADGPWAAAAAGTMCHLRGDYAKAGSVGAKAEAVRPVVVTGAPLLEVSGLRRTVKPGFELRPEDFVVCGGETVALAGPNGAGKSVLTEAILGLSRIDGGSLRLFGSPAASVLRDRKLKRRLGAQLQNVAFPGLLKVSEIARMHLGLYRHQIAELAGALRLGEIAGESYGRLSLGQRQRVHLFMALAHDPDLAILDEPSLGLDESAAHALRDELDARRVRGKATLVATHVASDLARCDRLVCLKAGRTFAAGSPDEVVRRCVGQFRAWIDGPLTPEAATELARLNGIMGTPRVKDGTIIAFGADGFDRSFAVFLERFRLPGYGFGESSAADLLETMAAEENR